MRTVLVCGIALILLLATQISYSQNNINIRQIEDSDFPDLSVLVDIASEPDEVSADDFTVEVGGETATITGVQGIRAEGESISVVLVIDTSESMFGKPLDDTKAAAIQFLSSLSPEDEVAIVTFSERAELIQPFTTDVALLETTVNELIAVGRTALYSATATAVDVSEQANTDNRFIVFLTDGWEFGGLSDISQDDSLTRAQEAGVPVFSIGLGYDNDAEFLNQLASQTDGDYYASPTPDSLGGIFSFLSEFLRTEYVLDVSTDLEPDGSSVPITVSYLDDVATTDYASVNLYPVISADNLPTEAVTTETTLDVQITAERGLQSVAATVNGVPITLSTPVDAPQDFAVDVVLNPDDIDGMTNIVVTATDAEGGQSTQSYMVDVVGTPQFSVAGIDEDVLLEAESLTITTELAPFRGEITNVIFAVDDVAVQQSTDMQFVLDSLAFPLGDHTLDISVVTDMGEFTDSRSFTVLPIDANGNWTPVTQDVDGVEMVLVPAGCFDMGGGNDADEQPEHRICISDSFWIDRYPVTNEQYGSSGTFTGAQNPRDRLTWTQASEYCQKSREGRLPSEAEWEFAARGPDSLIYPWGDLFEAQNLVSDTDATQPVGQHPSGASWVGAEDMSGNIWEWTSSAYQPYPYTPETDASADDTTWRVLRGGAATNQAIDVTALNRFPRQPNLSFGLAGVRCVTDYTAMGENDDS